MGLHERIYKKVCDCMEKDKLFLDPRLSLIRLGLIVGTAINLRLSAKR